MATDPDGAPFNRKNMTYASIEDAPDGDIMRFCDDCQAWTPHVERDDGTYQCQREAHQAGDGE